LIDSFILIFKVYNSLCIANPPGINVKETFFYYKHILVIVFLIFVLMVLHYFSPIHLTWFAPLFFERFSAREKTDRNIQGIRFNGLNNPNI
tara:strand:- start:15796 stop:16068 length:273 start_codon:yes stop_codon:yes gene_type:complete